MTFSNFKEILDLIVRNRERIDTLYKLSIDIDNALPENERIVDKLWEHILTEDGKEMLDWFLYEKMYYFGELDHYVRRFENEKEICKDLEGLYNYLKDKKHL